MKLNITDVAKFNPYHDARGRFTTGSGATSFTIRTKDPSKQYMADRAVAREKDKHSQANPPVKRNDDFHGIVGDMRYEEVQNVAHSCDNENIGRLWDEHFPEVSFQSYNFNSCYSPVFDTVKLNINDIDENTYETRNEAIFHEMAHAIDHRTASKNGLQGRGGATFSQAFEDGAFIKTLQSEYKAIEKHYKEKLETETGGKAKISEVRDYMRRELAYDWEKGSFGNLRQPKDRHEWSNTWDIMQGCCKSKIRFPIGHDKSYYQGNFAERNLGTEAFAEMYAATLTNPKSLANIKQHFPESYKVFERMLGAM